MVWHLKCRPLVLLVLEGMQKVISVEMTFLLKVIEKKWLRTSQAVVAVS